MRLKTKIIKGFTLIEMLLVLVIIGAIVYASLGYMQQRAQTLRINKTTAQLQQILNAGMAYYIANGSWPASIAPLLNGYFLPSPPSGTFNNPYLQPYSAIPATPASGPGPSPVTPQVFFAYTAIKVDSSSTAAPAIAAAIAGQLPTAYTTAAPPTAGQPPVPGTPCTGGVPICWVVASVNIPGSNLNNATAVNFAGLFRHGGCVPVPSCPKDVTGTAMVPQIVVAPVSVSGLNDTSSGNTYPITSFGAYATGNTPPDKNPPQCENSNIVVDCNIWGGTPAASAYWRACLKVITSQGDLNASGNANWGGEVSIMAITRCAIQGEPSGSAFDVFSN